LLNYSTIFIPFEKVSEELKSKKYGNSIHSFINLFRISKGIQSLCSYVCEKINQIKSLEFNEAAILLQLREVKLENAQHFDILALLRKTNQYLVMNETFQPIKWIEFL
jgi:hypothetical protein